MVKTPQKEMTLDIKKEREKLSISQARLSEISGIPQHTLSALELKKISPLADQLGRLYDVFHNIDEYEESVHRKKRYRKHDYKQLIYDTGRRKKCTKTKENNKYLEEIDLLMKPALYKQSYSVLSLFAGCGGMSLGFKSAGYAIKGFVEIDKGLSNIYSKNFLGVKQLGSDITKISDSEIDQFLKENGQTDLIVGGPPCQGFSLSGKRDIEDPRNILFKDYIRIVKKLRPRIAVMENVRLLTSMKSSNGTLVKDDIIGEFQKLDYVVRFFEVNASQYGVPQHRERVFFIAFHSDLKQIPTFPIAKYSNSNSIFPDIRSIRSFADACSDLDYLESGEKSQSDQLHYAVQHPSHVLEWLWDVPEGKSAHENDNPVLRPPSGYNTTYKRQVWLEPAATVQTTSGMISGCRNVHPIATRSLTIREAARLQSFPDQFIFDGPSGIIRKGIGNAVPPLLARSIAIHLRSILSD